MDYRECGWCGDLFELTGQRRRDNQKCCCAKHGRLLDWRNRRNGKVAIIRTWLMTDAGIVEVSADEAYEEPKLKRMHAAWLKLLCPQRYEAAILLRAEEIIRERRS